jgi:hypothetical protein
MCPTRPYLPRSIRAMQPEGPHTPPLRNLQTLPPDTVAVSRHTSGANYRTGDLKLGRAAVLADLQRYLQVPFDCLLKHVGALPPLQDLHRIRNNLTESKVLTDDESGLRWTDFTPPNASKGSEENVFEPLGRIIDRILAETPNRRVSFVANPNVTPLSERNNTSRPDGYLVLSKEKNKRKIHWFDIAVPFEFKKAQDRESFRDVSRYRFCRRPLTKPALGRREDNLEPSQYHARGSLSSIYVRYHNGGHAVETVAHQSCIPCSYSAYQLLPGTQTYPTVCQGANRPRTWIVLSRYFTLLDLPLRLLL